MEIMFTMMLLLGLEKKRFEVSKMISDDLKKEEIVKKKYFSNWLL